MSYNKLATIVDIANMFWSINIHKDSRKYTHFYYNKRIYRHARLGQGLKNSPYISVKALRYTLSTTVLQNFLSSINCTNFPYKTFDDFVIQYIDDIGIFTPISHEEWDPHDLHYTAVRAVLYALQEVGWLHSKGKCQFLTKSFKFLGIKIHTNANYSCLQDDRIRSILDWRKPKSIAETEYYVTRDPIPA